MVDPSGHLVPKRIAANEIPRPTPPKAVQEPPSVKNRAPAQPPPRIPYSSPAPAPASLTEKGGGKGGRGRQRTHHLFHSRHSAVCVLCCVHGSRIRSGSAPWPRPHCFRLRKSIWGHYIFSAVGQWLPPSDSFPPLEPSSHLCVPSLVPAVFSPTHLGAFFLRRIAPALPHRRMRSSSSSSAPSPFPLTDDPVH